MKPKSLDLSKITVKNFFPEKASRQIWMQYHQLNEKLLFEAYPEEKFPKRAFTEKELTFEQSDYNIYRWLVYKDDSKCKLIGICSFGNCKEHSPLYDKNKEIGFADLYIDSDFRRQGLGTKLLKKIAFKLKEMKCKYFKASTPYPSGKIFCEKYGAKLTNIKVKSRLPLKNVDWELVNVWIKDGKKRNSGVTIESYFGASERKMKEHCELMTELESEAPILENSDETFQEIYTPQRYREFEQYLKERKFTLYTLRSIEPTGKISGLTEIFFSRENRPEQINTGLTGVKSRFRGRGLGKWLKAQMLHYIKDNLPRARYLITGNAEHNKPILSINYRLGFTPYARVNHFKLTIDKLLELL
ncbi:MAG: GNAT family N-acetyltransferase [Candidatus Heimdallarchaeota archaeon]|nr:GNAT family N-acetyltransferase [Candidatus Heimdallarchaeota archaeon]